RAHAAAGRQVAVVVQFDAALDAQEAERLADGRVLDVVEGGARLDGAVDDAQAMLEEGGEGATGEVAILVDRRGEYGAAMGAIPGRVVRSPSNKGDAKRGAANDHSFDLCGESSGRRGASCSVVRHRGGTGSTGHDASPCLRINEVGLSRGR